LRRAAFLLILLFTAGVGVPAVQKKQQPSPKASSSSKSTSSKKTATSKTAGAPPQTVRRNPSTTKTGTSTKKSTRARTRRNARQKGVPNWRRGQQEPTPERYREIQQALIGRGYLQAPGPEKWGPESVEALKRFQQDQKLEASGKLDSLSIIALGLGPKRDLASQNGRLPSAQPPPEGDR
jgi:peptidoglycan hydrolase-like protein with peptidoglycan-binding domain